MIYIMATEDAPLGDLDADQDRERAFEDRKHEYDERRRVIQMVELFGASTAYERSRPLFIVFMVSLVLAMFTVLTCLIIVVDLFPRGTNEYYLFLLIAPIVAYATSLWALLYVRRVRRHQRFEMESTLSIFQRELARNWARNDALEAENLRLRERAALRNRMVHNWNEQNGTPGE